MTHDAGALSELLVVAGASLAVLLLFQRLRLPAAVGFIVTGVLIGPGGLAWIRDASLVHALADFGVMFLLFTVGLEFSRAEIIRLGRAALVGGSLQVSLTGGAVALVAMARGLHPAQAIFIGMLASLSSTALVFRVLTDRLELGSPHGRMAAGVLVFQDLVVLVFAVAVPWLGRWQSGVAGDAVSIPPLSAIAQLAAVALAFGVALRGVPWLLRRALRASREAFLFGVVVVALGSAFLTARVGLSAALGAFVAGLILADSDLRSHVEAGVVSFRDALTGVFFVAIGMLFEPRVVLAHPGLVLASTLGLVGLKAAIAAVALRAAGATGRVAFAGGVALAQVGEFSFLLASTAPAGLLGATGGQVFFAGAVFSLLLTPFLVHRAAEWSHAVARRAGGGGAATPPATPEEESLTGHVVIAGFGLNGSNVARVLRSVRLPHIVVDLSPDALRSQPAEGSRLLLGDITQPDIQRRAGIERARLLIVALSDPVATRHACGIARSLSPKVFILVRTRTVAEIDELYRLGANQVIPEEFETSIEIFTAALRHFHVPSNIIQAQVQLLREERYSLLRGLKLPGSVVEQLDTLLEAGTCDTFLLLQHSPAVGRSLGELDLLEGPGARVVAMVRGGAAVTALLPERGLQVGDILVMAGSHAAMEEAFRRLSPHRPS